MHYTCIVFGEDVEGQLEPYDENVSVERYKAYWDSDTIERWEGILRETTTMRGNGDEREGVELPPEQVLTVGEYSLEDLARVYHARYRDDDEHARENTLLIDDGGIYEWSTYSTKSKWDWYVIGGRWTGFFKLKSHAALAGAVLGKSGAFDNQPRHDADEAIKGDIDIEWMRDQAGTSAAKVWDRVHSAVGHLPEALGWEDHFAGRLKLTAAGEDEYTIEQAREDYHGQERVKAFTEWNAALPDEEKVSGWDGPSVEDFQIPREEFIEQARYAEISPYSYILGGEWNAAGNMHWFSSSETKAERRRYQQEFNELLDSLPDDTLLTLVDLHI